MHPDIPEDKEKVPRLPFARVRKSLEEDLP